ncbi:hypothetical protein EJD97_000536, partial [Solanum chilense]
LNLTIMESTSDQGGTSAGNQLPAHIVQDLTSVFYIHPSKNAGSTIFLVVYDGSGYRSWMRAVLQGLSVKNKTGDTSSNFRTNYTSNRNSVGTSKPPNKSNLFCDYCKRTGHIKDKCYRLHGFTPDFKFTKGKNAGISSIANGFSEEPMRDSCEKTPETGKCKEKCMNSQDKF